MRIIFTIILLVLIVIGVLFFLTDMGATRDDISDPINTATSTDERVVDQSTWETYSDTLSAAVSFSLDHPRDTTVTEVEDGAIYEIKYIGPNSEPNTEITDGYYVTLQFIAATSAQAYANEQAENGQSTATSFLGQDSYRYTTMSELNDQTITHYAFVVEDSGGYLADISFQTYGSANYQSEVDQILNTLSFTTSASQTSNLIQVDSPTSGATIDNPVTVSGEARGQWFFEATAPVVVVNWDGLIIGEGYVTAEGEWMTEDFVPFSGTIEYELDSNAPNTNGAVIFQRSNPSGLPENDAAVEIPVQLTE